jgi:GH18 family chitinase
MYARSKYCVEWFANFIFVPVLQMKSFLDKGWKRVWLETEKVPYAYDMQTKQWIGYDDEESIKIKVSAMSLRLLLPAMS